MRIPVLHAIALLLPFWTTQTVLAQKKVVTFETAFSGEFTPKSSSFTWTSADNDGTYIVKDGETNNLLFANIITNETEVFVDADTLGLQYYAYEIQPSRENVLFSTDYTKQWRHSYNASYHIFNRESGETVPLVDDQDGEIQYATWSPVGNVIAFVRQNDLYLWNDGEVTRVTEDGNPDIFNGIPDWVYEEEIFGDRYTLWFSPDGEYLAFLRFDETGVGSFSVPYYMDSGVVAPPYPHQLDIRYPKVGTTNPTVSMYLLNVVAFLESSSSSRGSVLSEVKFDTFPQSEVIIGEVAWVTDTHENLIFRTFNRVQDMEKLVLVDVKRRVRTSVVRERDGTDGWLDDMIAIQWVGDGSYIDISDESGWRHIYLHSLTGGEPKALTSGEWEVTSILKVDPARQLVYYQSTEHDSTERHIYSVSITTGEKTALVDDSEAGYWSASFSSEAGFYVLSYQGPNMPHQELYSINDTTPIRTIESNSDITAKLEEYTLPQVSWSTFNSTEGYALNFVEALPANFDPSKKYPVLFDIYGGPGSQDVTKSYKRVSWQFYLGSDPELEYIVVSLDNRGTGNKGRDFRSLVTGQLGKLEAEDQVNAARDYASTRSYVDADKIAIWGWSYGGYLTAKVLETNSGVFSLGLITAPVSDWRFYDTMYTERYMKTPDTNLDGYIESSVNKSEGFKNVAGGFLIQHGTGDDNVHFQNTAAMVDFLVRDGVSPQQMHSQFFTDSDHGIRFHGANVFLYKQLTEMLYLEKNREGPVASGHQWSRRHEIWRERSLN